MPSIATAQLLLLPLPIPDGGAKSSSLAFGANNRPMTSSSFASSMRVFAHHVQEFHTTTNGLARVAVYIARAYHLHLRREQTGRLSHHQRTRRHQYLG